jgi:hypothetical protein
MVNNTGEVEMAKANIDSIQKKMEAFAKILQGTVTRTQGNKNTTLKMELPVNDGVEILLEFFGDSTSPMCTTNYKAHGRTFTFNRLGVEDSFYYETLAKLPEQFAEQVERAKERQAVLVKSQRVDLGPVALFMTDEAKQAMVDKLKRGETYCYFPSGFGTGYNFTISFRRERFPENIKASYELERLVGQRVFVSSFDAD